MTHPDEIVRQEEMARLEKILKPYLKGTSYCPQRMAEYLMMLKVGTKERFYVKDNTVEPKFYERRYYQEW